MCDRLPRLTVFNTEKYYTSGVGIMAKHLFLFGMVFCLFITGVFAQDAVVSPFTQQGDSPIVERPRRTRDNRDADLWDGQYTDPGAVLYHDGQFHMFRNGFVGWPARVRIGYLVSDDGITWTEPQDEPILDTLDVPYAEVAALASSAYVEDDGTWVLYFYTWNTTSGSGQGAIGRATAANPLGPWTVDAEPVLEVGEAGAWDSAAVSSPSVIRTDDGFVMYYTGTDDAPTARIGMATSEDGINWTRSENNPILEATEEWEGGMVHQPRVIFTGEQWLMVYRSQGAGGAGGMRFGIATSDDGFTWTKSAANPILSPAAINGARSFWFTSLAYNDGTVYLYQEATPGMNVTDIYVLTAPLSDLLGN
jgi:predicted GH43/DUF377 family glycosyl hydrolase